MNSVEVSLTQMVRGGLVLLSFGHFVLDGLDLHAAVNIHMYNLLLQLVSWRRGNVPFLPWSTCW